MENVINHILKNYYGIKEVEGKESNETILGWQQKAIPMASDDSKIPWCSIFVSNMLIENEIPTTMTLTARSWLEWGIPTTSPTLGDLVVLWRKHPNSWQGHVGFFIRKDENYVWILGGNQSDAVNIKKYPLYRVLGYRKNYTNQT